MATEAVRDITEGLILPPEGAKRTRAVKLTPEVISCTAEVPWFNHFVAQEARECC